MRFILITCIVLLIQPSITNSQHHPYCFIFENPEECNESPSLCPQQILQAQKTSNFVVEYEGYTPEAITAFEFAVDILEKVIVSNVPITVRTRLFQPSMQNILGGGTSDFVRDFPGSKPNLWYASPLADAISGIDTNPDSFDIEVLMNRDAAWYFGTDGNAGGSQLDFISVVLHELGHGIGFGSGMEMLEEGETNVPGAVNQVSYGLRTEPFPYFTLQMLNFNGLPLSYDQFLVNASNQMLTDQSLFQNGSPELTTQAISNTIVWRGNHTLALNQNIPPKIYAPNPFINGSSLSHIDEILYNSSSQNALMTPSISRREVQHDPGPIMLGMLQDLGWIINPDVLPAQSTIPAWEIYR